MTEDIQVIDDGFDGDNFFGVDLADVRKIKKEAELGYMAMQLYPPPEGAIWGEYNNRKMEEPGIASLLGAFKQGIDFCTDPCAIDVAVKRHWVENIEEALPTVEGKKMPALPVLKLTEAGKKEIVPRNLWMLSGNHRRETLKRYLDELKAEVNVLKEKVKGVKGGKTESELSSDKNKELDGMKAIIVTKERIVENSKNWVVRLYDRGACGLRRGCSLEKDADWERIYLSEFIDGSNTTAVPDMGRIVFRLISRNETKGNKKATEEEFLQEIVDHFKDAFVSDRAKINDWTNGEDYEVLYPTFMARVVSKAEEFKRNVTGYRQICCLPRFALALVMMSRVRSHYTHSPWFNITDLKTMVEVHGGVSETH